VIAVTRQIRIKAAMSAAAAATALAGPLATGAAAATHGATSAKRATSATSPASVRNEKRALERELKAAEKLRAEASTTSTGPGGAINDLIANLEFQLTPQGLQDLLGDFPVVGLYG
jgi:hypothetical protein